MLDGFLLFEKHTTKCTKNTPKYPKSTQHIFQFDGHHNFSKILKAWSNMPKTDLKIVQNSFLPGE